MADSNPSQPDENTPLIRRHSQDGIDWETWPKKRKPRVVLLIVFFSTAVGIIVYGLFERKVAEYRAHNDNFTISWLKMKKTPVQCYTKEEKTTYPVFFNIGLGLMGIILGTIVDRLCLFIQELCQLQSRYNGRVYKVFKSCFSGVNWPAVALVLAIVCGSCVLGKETSIVLADIIYVLGGIGVGPLVIHLLNLDTESEIDVSRILEEKKMYPGYTLAWSYYFNHLQPEVQKLKTAITERQAQVSWSSSPTENKRELSSNKLILLLPPSMDVADIDELIDFDETIEKVDSESAQNPYPFPVYHFREHGKTYAMKCVKEPIVALREMMRSTGVIFVSKKTYADEVKRLYRELREILKDPEQDGYTNKGLIVPITIRPGHVESLRQRGLANIIMVKVASTTASNDHAPSLSGRMSNGTGAFANGHLEQLE